MRILFLCKTFPASDSEAIVSGEVKNAYYLAVEMAKLGHEVVVWSAGTHRVSFRAFGLEVEQFPRVPLKGALISVGENLLDAFRFAGAKRFDVVINHRLTSPILILLIAKFRFGAKVVNTAHGTNWPEINANRFSGLRGTLTWANGLLQRVLDSASYRVSDTVVSVSAYQCRELADVYRVPIERTAVVRNGIDLDRYSLREEAAPSEQEQRVLFVGRLVRKKGLDLVLRAAAALKRSRPGVRFVLVVGSPEYAKMLSRFDAMVDELGLREDLEIVWSVPEADLPLVYRSASVLLAPSQGYESLPTVLLEALASGIPVLTTRAWGTLEAVKDSRMLLVTAELDEIVTKLEALLDDPPTAARLREMVSEVSWEAQTLKYLALIESPSLEQAP